MALIHWDGLDSYNSISDFYNSDIRFLYHGNAAWYNYGGRFNGATLRSSGFNNSDTYQFYVGAENISKVWVGRAQYSSGATNSQNIYLFVGRSNTGIESTVTIDTDGSIKAYRGDKSTLIGNTAPAIFTRDKWHWVEIYYGMDSSNGAIDVWVDNKQVLTVTGANTKQNPSGTANLYTITYCGEWYNGFTVNDDFYILDTNGPAPYNNRLGDLRISTVYPTSDLGGTNSSFTSTNAGSHFAAVNDAIVGYNTNKYLYANAANIGETELFANPGIGGSPNTIFAVGVINITTKSDVGNGSIQNVLVDTNDITYKGNAQYEFYGSWTPNRTTYVNNPATGNTWKNSELANTKFGFAVG